MSTLAVLRYILLKSSLAFFTLGFGSIFKYKLFINALMYIKLEI
jgi:hypothetical protein